MRRAAYWQNSKARRLAAITVLLSAVYGPALLSPSLLGDEWGILYLYDNSQLACPSDTLRPLLFCWSELVYRVTGPNILAHKIVALISVVALGVLIVEVLDLAMPGKASVTTAIAAIYLLFPSVLVRTWLLGVFNVVPLLVVLFTYCYLRFWRSGGWPFLLLGLGFLITSLGMYEAQLGIVVAVCVLCALTARRGWRHRLGLMVPVLIVVVYAVWRYLAQVAVGTAFGHSVQELETSTSELLGRAVVGFQVNMHWVWTDLVADVFPNLAGRATVLNLVLLATVVLPMLAITLAGIARRWASPDAARAEVTWQEALRRWTPRLIAGIVLLGAGFFPAILAISPGLSFDQSRVNLFAAFGGAVVLVCLLGLVADLIESSLLRNQSGGEIFAAGVIPLLLWSSVGQLHTQVQIHQAWEEQKALWTQLLAREPGLPEDSVVVFFLKGYDETMTVYPLINGAWATSSTLRLLYDDDSLDAFYEPLASVRDALHLSGSELAIRFSYLGEKVFNLENTLVYEFDADTHLLTPVDGPDSVHNTGQEAVDTSDGLLVETYPYRKLIVP